MPNEALSKALQSFSVRRKAFFALDFAMSHISGCFVEARLFAVTLHDEWICRACHFSTVKARF
jgi:hypothetical protein